jgi:hypothetical protein
VNQQGYPFPSLLEKDKGVEYHKRFAQAIVSNTISDSYATNYAIIAECYKFVQEGTDGKLTEHLQTDETGDALPAPWLTIDSIGPKIDLLTGELEERGYEIKVRALNKEAISRKLETKEKLRVRRRLQQIVSFVEKEVGIALEDPEEYIPQSEAELDEYFDLTFKDKVEIVMESALKYLAKRNQWDEERKLLFRDILIGGRAFVKNEIVRGLPVTRRIDPLCFIHDPDCKTDTLEDATYFGEVEYLPLSAAAERYNLTEDELKQVEGKYNTYLNGQGVKHYVGQQTDHDFGSTNGRIKWFKNIDGQTRVLVVRACWLDYKITKYKSEKNKKYGTEHLQEITEDVRQRKDSNIITDKMQVWRQCTLVGGVITREWGECPNQARDLSNLEVTEAPYKAWIPNFSTGRGVSKVEKLAGLQLAKDIAMYNMNVAMTRAGAKGMQYDLAMVPEGWAPETVIKYMKVYGISFVNSKESQMMPGATNAFKEFDMTLSESIAQYISIMQFYDSEMSKISGVSQEREGIVQGASQAVGVTNSALFQSNLITKPYFNGFSRFCERIFNHQAKLVKIVFPKAPELFAPIIGDSGVDFLREHIDLDLDTMGIYIENVPPMLVERQRLEQLVMMAVQADPELLPEALKILTETDLRVAIRRFQRTMALQKIYRMQQEQAQQEQEAALQARMQDMQAQNMDKQLQAQLQLQQMKNDNGMAKTLATGRVKLSEQKLKTLADFTKPQPNRQ